MLEVRFGYTVDFFNQVQSPDDFIFDLLSLLNKEIFEVVLVRYDSSEFLFFVHQAKILIVARK